MSFDLLKNHVVQIKFNDSQSTGVIFKPEINSGFLYILTAKHNFFLPKEISRQYQDLELNLENDTIKITHEITNQIIPLTQNRVYFFNSEDSEKHFINIDLALIIIEINGLKNQITDLPSIDTLFIEDDQNNRTGIYDIHYSLFGYPQYRNLIHKEISHCKLKFNQSSTNSFYQEEFDNITGFVGFDESDNFQEELNGISGSPIFLLSKSQEPYLRSIAYATEKFNIIKAIKISPLVDSINSRIEKINANLPELRSSTKITLINEPLSISELKSFNDFKTRIRDKSETLNFIKKENENIISINEIAAKLLKDGDKLRTECEDLSYKYAHIAIIAADKGLKAATTSYLKKAIEWNSDHIHILLHEKAERTQNKELLRSLTPILLTDKIKKYDKLLKLEKDEFIIKELLKDAIIDLYQHTNDNNEKILANSKIDEYCFSLDELINNDKKQKPINKYIELGKFYSENHLKNKSIKFYLIALELLKRSPKNDYHNSLSEEVNLQIYRIKEKIDLNIFDEKQKDAIQIAKDIFNENEDKETKEIILKLYEEVTDLKRSEQYRDGFYSNLIDTLFSLNISIDKQIIQNIDKNIRINQSNANIESFTSLLNNLENKIIRIQDKYEIQIDEKTKNDILDTIQSPLDDFSNKIDNATEKVTQTTDAVNEIINHAEKQLSFIKQEGIKDLEAIKSDVQKRLTAFEQQEVQISAYKNEVLDYLKASEHRMLERIEQLYLNDTAKNEAIQVVQDSISQLEKTLLNTFASESKIQNYNNFSINKKIETVLNACRNLESTVITQTNDILSYSKDIDLVKNQQNALEDSLIPQTAQALAGLTQNQELLTHIRTNQYRLEHSLLTHTQHALNNYQNIINHQTIKPPLSKSKKIFLAVYFIVMFASALYFIIRYGLLDLLLNLWHTAWQQLNG